MTVLAQGRTLGTVRAEVDRRIEHRFLTHPHAVLHHGIHRAADGAVRAHGTAHDDVALPFRGLCLAHHRFLHQRELRGRQPCAHANTGALEEGPAIHGRQCAGQAARQTTGQRRRALAASRCGFRVLYRRFAGQKHRGHLRMWGACNDNSGYSGCECARVRSTLSCSTRAIIGGFGLRRCRGDGRMRQMVCCSGGAGSSSDGSAHQKTAACRRVVSGLRGFCLRTSVRDSVRTWHVDAPRFRETDDRI